MTLLKHEKTADGTPMLPLKLEKLRRIALIGPGLDLHGGDMQGPYSGEADCISVQDALLARVMNLVLGLAQWVRKNWRISDGTELPQIAS